MLLFLWCLSLGQLLPACMACHPMGNNMRILNVSKISLPLFRKLFTELLQFIYCCCSNVHTDQLSSVPAKLSPSNNPSSTRIRYPRSPWAAAQCQISRTCSYSGDFPHQFNMHHSQVPRTRFSTALPCKESCLEVGE